MTSVKKRLSGILTNLKEILDVEEDEDSYFETSNSNSNGKQETTSPDLSNAKSPNGSFKEGGRKGSTFNLRKSSDKDSDANKKGTLKYAQWTTAIEKKVKTILESLTSLSKITPAKNKSSLKKVITTTLQEVIMLLESDIFTFEDYNTNQKNFKSVREALLDLWSHLLEMLERVEDSDASNFYKAILSIIKRKEFDCSHLFLDVHNKPNCPEHDLLIAQRYRALLYTTQSFVIMKLSKVSGTAAKSHHLYLFCTKALAIIYFRVMNVDQLIVSAVSLDNTQKEEFAKALQTEFGITDCPFLSASSQEEKKESHTKFFSSVPSLFQWNLYHAALQEWNPDNQDEKLTRAPKEWLTLLGKHDPLYFMFLREWVLYIRSVVGDTPQLQIPWFSIPGFSAFVAAFLFEFKKSETVTKALLDASLALLLAEPSVINYFIKFTFTRTNVYSIPAVGECLANIEAWFKELRAHGMTLPPTFDSAFFIQGLHVILQTDHHQLLQKVLALIYNYAEVFEGESRKALFCDLLIKQYFFPLFLHWDDGTRNSFQQIIVFRTIRLKRSLLHAEGLINVEELATKELGISKKDQTQQGTASGTIMEEKENFLDAILFAKIESYVKMVQEQLRDASFNKYDKELEVYVPRALSEYKMYMSRYYQWERSGQSEPPKLVPMYILNTMNAMD